jgi:hypothetical protein
VGAQQEVVKEKALRAKVLRRVSENLSGMLDKLFSSFLRGASCPKSPRAPPLPATLFMRLTARYVNRKISSESYVQELTVARPSTRKRAAKFFRAKFRRGARNALQRRSLSR